MTALAHPQPEPRSGDNALTTAAQAAYPKGAAGWLAFFRFTTELYAEARSHGDRRYLEYPEWNKFFQAAVRYGCITRAEISGELVPLEFFSAAHPRANKRMGDLFHAVLIETYRQVREAKTRGDSAWHLASAMRARCTAYDAAQAEREKSTTTTREAAVSASSLHERKSRRRKPDPDDTTDD